MRRNLKEFWNVKQDGEDDDKHFVEFDIFICENRCFFELTIKTNSYVSLEAERKKETQHYFNSFFQWFIYALCYSFYYFLYLVTL